MSRERQTSSDSKASYNEAMHDNKADNPSRPWKADAGDQMLQKYGEYDPANGTTTENEANCEGASTAKPMVHNCHGWVEPAKKTVAY